MSTFIRSVLARLNNPGLSPRAEAIFTQAMTKGHYRWGRKAKLTAGASIAIALREAPKSDSLRDIAFLLDDSTVSLARTFQSVVSLLDFSLPCTDPAVHLPILQAHLQSIIHPDTFSPTPPSQLPKSLISVLAPLSLQTAVRTATSLSEIILHHSPPLALTHLPTPATACALLILGLEADARAPLPHLGDLTRILGTRFALAPGVVSSRYKIIYDLIEEWIRHVPWLDQFVYKGQGCGASARSKVPKRAIVAKGIKDVIQFHEEIWLSRTENQQKIKLDLELDPGEFADEEEGDNESVNTPTLASSSKHMGASVIAPPPAKRRKGDKKGDGMQAAHRFLQDPLSSRYLCAARSNGEISPLTHILTCPPDELSRAQGVTPTRLQLLATSRGGSTAEDIADEELFSNGELEGLLRSEQEQEALRPLFELNWGEELSRQEAADCNRKPVETKRGAKRVDMGALARLLGKHDADSSDEEPERDDDVYLHHSDQQSATEDAEPVSDWRPASPDDSGFGEYMAAGDRYEQEL